MNIKLWPPEPWAIGTLENVIRSKGSRRALEPSPTHVLSIILAIALFLPGFTLARVIEKDPRGFYGISWGQSLSGHPNFVRIESEANIDRYSLKEPNPEIGGIPVESIKFLTFDDQFAQVTIHYRGEKTHNSLLDYLESQYGEIDLNPGSMMRGLNQQYTWRGPETEITLTYRGLGQRGFMAVESREMAPKFMESISEHSF